MTVLSQNAIQVHTRASPAAKPLSSQASTWVLLAPLFCYACNGMFWFRTSGSSDDLNATYGTLASGGSGLADNVAIMAVLLLTLSFPLLSRARAILRVLQRNPVFLLIPMWVSASFLWSQIPLVSLEWSPAAVLIVLFACFLHCRFSPEEQLRLFLMLGTVCLFLSLALSSSSLTYRDHMGGWYGVYSQKNICCMVTEFLLLSALYASGKGLLFRIFRAVYVVGSIFLIIMTQSATGRLTLSLLLAFVLLTKLLPRLRRIERKLLLLSAAAFFVASAVLGFAAYASIARLLGKDPTLTGRTEIWLAVIPSIMRHPLLGYGYRAFWRGYQGESAYVSLFAHWAPPNAHNALLEIWLTLGAVGVVSILFTIFQALRNGFLCLINTNSSHLAWYTSIVVLMLLVSVDEAEMVSPYGLMWMLYIFACLGLSSGVRQLRRELACA